MRFQEVGAGAAAGAIEYTVCQPIDKVKTRLHIAGSRGRTVRGELASIWSEGGIAGLYRGLGPQLLAAIPIAIGMFVGHASFLRAINAAFVDSRGESGDRPAAWCASAFAGFLSGFTEGTIATPFELAKVRLHAPQHDQRYRNTLHVFASTGREGGGGVQAYFRGIQATCARNAAFNSVFFGVVATAKDCGWGGGFGGDLALGFGAAQVATLVKMPFDVAKSRTQSEVVRSAGCEGGATGPPRYRGVAATLSRIAREEGIGALYRGTAATALRMGVGMSVALATFEWLKPGGGPPMPHGEEWVA